MSKRIVVLIVTLTLLLAAATIAHAQIAATARLAPPDGLDRFYGMRIEKVEFDIPTYMDRKAIIRVSKLQDDKRFTRWRMRQTLRNMSLIDQIENVAIRVEPVGDDRVKVIIKIYPRYILRDIRVVGNFTFNVSEILEDILHIEPGDDFRPEMLSEYKRKITEAYKDVGHLKAHVKIDWQKTKRKDDNKADLRIKINERPTYKIVHFDFTEAELSVYSMVEILKIAKWKPGMNFSQEDVNDGLARLKKWLRKNGHFEARLPDLDLSEAGAYRINHDKSEMVLVFPIKIGPRVDVIYEPTCFTCAEKKWKLDDVLDLDNQRRFNKWVAKDFAKKVQLFFLRQGYYNAKVKPKYREYTEPNGMQVKEIILCSDRGEKVTIHSIDWKENPSFKDNELTALLSQTDFYVEEDFENDLKNVINHYNSNGFLQAKVVQKVIDYDAAKDRIDVVIVMDEGPQTRVQSVKYLGNSVVTDEELAEALDEMDVELKVGEPFNPFTMQKIKVALLYNYLRQGYVKARVKETVKLSEDGKTVDLTFTFTEKQQYFFGNIYYRGNKLTKRHVIARELVVVEGRPYNFEQIFRSEQALIQLGFFNSVDISPVAGDFEDQMVDMMVTVNERKSGYIQAGVGYNTYLGWRGAYELGHRNLAGHGRRLSFRFEAFVTDPSFEFDRRNTAVSFTWPWMGRVPLDGSLTIRDMLQNEIAYDVRSFGLTVGTTLQWQKMLNFLEATHPSEEVRDFAGKRSTRRTFDPFTTKLDWELARDFLYNIDPLVQDQEVGEITITTFSPMIIFDKRDNIFNPTRLTYNTLRFDYGAPWALSQIHYLKATASTAWYLPIYELLPFLSGWVFAENIVVGHGQALRITDTIPINRRYFLGGSTTLRGFGQNQISPLAEDGKTPVGGYFMAYQNTEIRLPMGDSGFGLLMFFDAGDVTNGTNTFYLDRLRTTAGLGFRYITPVGPLSADYGIKLNRRPEETFGEFYLTIGNAF
ncbi:MAG TPA: outer membrane protein assembly factor BamA [bacterium]|nr:outer membrane protein assembly factor BamA [bacterium]